MLVQNNRKMLEEDHRHWSSVPIVDFEQVSAHQESTVGT